MDTSNLFERDGKTIIPVPCGYRYISDWTEFSLGLFGRGAFIVDKQIPGCGFTEYCLTSDGHIVLTSPRRILLDNKESQHLGEVFYAKNICSEEDNLPIDKDITKDSKVNLLAEDKEAERTKEESNHEALTQMEKDLMEYCRQRSMERKPMKIIVTYDSFKHVKRFLIENNLLSLFTIVVDEFQSIFVDSRFKASTEFGFLEELKKLPFNSVCYVSATPMMDKYLKQLDYFKNLPYYELDWKLNDSGRVVKPELKVRKTKSVNTEIKRIIQDYLDGNFSVLANPMTGLPVQSTEAVFYVNSVNNILGVIKSMGLTPGQCNILCADTSANRKRLKKRLGSKFTIGSVPLKGEPHKMFTFCTRTVYLGADFYSTCARTFIFSDANIDSLAVDISLDLPQILGRQRLIENPWKNHAEFFFKNLGDDKELIKEDFDAVIRKKVSESVNKLSLYEKADMNEKKTLVRDYRTVISSTNYRDDYVSVNFDGITYAPVMNNLVLIAEQRAYDIQQVDYKDRFSVFSTIKSENGVKLDKMSEFIDYLRNPENIIPVRLRVLCETSEFTEDEKKMIAQQASEKFDKFYNLLGPERCKALGYNQTKLTKEIEDMLIPKDKIKESFLISFEVGKRYTNTEAKEMVRKIYQDLNINKSPKAVDVKEFFSIKKAQIIMPDKTKVNGLEILGIL